VNSRRIGNRTQLKLMKSLRREGWVVSKVEQGGKFVTEKDAFGLFDLLCINEQKILLIQVTTNRPHVHKNYKEFSKKYPVPSALYEQWVWFGRRGWKKFSYQQGTMKTTDMRVKPRNKESQ
jgi:hypothetical protein